MIKSKRKALKAIWLIIESMKNSVQRQALAAVATWISDHTPDDLPETFEEAEQWEKNYYLTERKLMMDKEKIERCQFLLEGLPLAIVFSETAAEKKPEITISYTDHVNLIRWRQAQVENMGIKIKE